MQRTKSSRWWFSRVDMGNTQVFAYDKAKAAALSAAVLGIPGVVFEAHSTDFQTESALADLVATHFAILKVGPSLTFAFREAVVAMAAIEERLVASGPSEVLAVLEQAMNDNPVHWRGYVAADDNQRLARLFGLSSRPHSLLLARPARRGGGQDADAERRRCIRPARSRGRSWRNTAVQPARSRCQLPYSQLSDPLRQGVGALFQTGVRPRYKGERATPSPRKRWASLGSSATSTTSWTLTGTSPSAWTMTKLAGVNWT